MAWYTNGKASLLNGSLDLLSDTIKVLLVDADYVFDASHSFASQVNSWELSGTGYIGGFGGSGRKILSGKAVVEGASSYFDANDLPWIDIQAGITAGAVLLKERATDADSPLVAFVPFPAISTTGGDLTIQWSATGILQI
jgi:hypothetical protein